VPVNGVGQEPNVAFVLDVVEVVVAGEVAVAVALGVSAAPATNTPPTTSAPAAHAPPKIANRRPAEARRMGPVSAADVKAVSGRDEVRTS
jgi:hypothetical protein